MANLVKQAMKLIVGDDPRKVLKRPLKPLTDRQLIKLESEIGRTLFGEIPAGHTREFFCLDAETWVWYEQWVDKNGKPKDHTIRYEVHPNGILKVQDSGTNYSFLSGQELENLSVATQTYRERVARELYKRDPETGKPLMTMPGIIRPM
jgi:hypothetical protein